MKNIILWADICWPKNYIRDLFCLPECEVVDCVGDPVTLKSAGRESILISDRDFTKFAASHNPKIIVAINDEVGKGADNIIYAARYTDLVLYQYNYAGLEIIPNAMQIPLGYIDEFPFVDGKFKPSGERVFNAAFVGALKNDRAEMLEKFARLDGMGLRRNDFRVSENSWKAEDQKVSPADMQKIYMDTIFVPVGRGYTNLNCYRIYEALECGAVPVVCGSEAECGTTFHFNGFVPPIIFAESWDVAADKCAQLLVDIGELEKLQRKCSVWWKTINARVSARIARAWHRYS